MKKEPVTVDELAWAKVRRASGPAAARMTNQGIVEANRMKARMAYPPGGASQAAELGAVTAEDVRAEFQACLSGKPTLSIVGDENGVQAAVQAGWR